jgi:hypothetical protein
MGFLSATSHVLGEIARGSVVCWLVDAAATSEIKKGKVRQSSEDRKETTYTRKLLTFDTSKLSSCSRVYPTDWRVLEGDRRPSKR